MQLHRKDVLDGALELLQADGLEGLTVRKLGAHLGVQGPALYWHFPSKIALLDAVADRLFEGVGASLPSVSWDEQLMILAGRLRDALLSHRDGARVVAGTYVAGPNTHLVETSIFGILQTADLPPERAGWVAFALSYYVLGHTIEEQSQAQLTAAGTWAATLDAMTEQADPGFARTALAAGFDADPGERFKYGLRLFIDGIRHQLSESPAIAPTGTPRSAHGRVAKASDPKANVMGGSRTPRVRRRPTAKP